MSDISSNSSFELISNSNRSDVNEPSIGSGNSANEIQNANSSDVVEPKIQEAEAPDVLAEQISLKKSTPDRKPSDIRVDIDQSSHSDNTNTRLSEERKRKLHERNLYDAEAREFGLILSATFLLIICFLLIGALVFLFSINGRPKAIIVKKCNVTTQKVYNFSIEKRQKFMEDVRIKKEDIDRFKKISEMQKLIQGKTDVDQLPENLWNKFVPDFSRFEGVKKFLKITQTRETIVEDYLYYSLPIFQIEEGRLDLQFVFMDTLEIVEDFWIGDCEKFNKRCHNVNWFLYNGNLYIHETFTLNSHEYEFTRVYFIPPQELI